MQRLNLWPNVESFVGKVGLLVEVRPTHTAAPNSIVLCYTAAAAAAVIAVVQTATLRILLGMALVALQSFKAGLDHDKALLSGTPTTSSSNGDGGSSSSGSSGGSSAAGDVQSLPEGLAAAEALSGDMQLAVLFRSQKKQLLLDVISGLAEKLKQVGSDGWGLSALVGV